METKSQFFLPVTEKGKSMIEIRLPSDEEIQSMDERNKNKFEVLSTSISAFKLVKEGDYKTLVDKDLYRQFKEKRLDITLGDHNIYEYIYKLYTELGNQCLHVAEQKYRFIRLRHDDVVSVNNVFQILSVEQLETEDVLDVEQRKYWMISLAKLIIYELRRYLTGKEVNDDIDPPKDNFFTQYKSELDFLYKTPLYYGLIYCLQKDVNIRDYIKL